MMILIALLAFIAGIIWGSILITLLEDYKMKKFKDDINSQYDESNKSNNKDNGK